MEKEGDEVCFTADNEYELLASRMLKTADLRDDDPNNPWRGYSEKVLEVIRDAEEEFKTAFGLRGRDLYKPLKGDVEKISNQIVIDMTPEVENQLEMHPDLSNFDRQGDAWHQPRGLPKIPRDEETSPRDYLISQLRCMRMAEIKRKMAHWHAAVDTFLKHGGPAGTLTARGVAERTRAGPFATRDAKIKEQKLKIQDLKDSQTLLLGEISNLKRAREGASGEVTAQELSTLRHENNLLQTKSRKLEVDLDASLEKTREWQRLSETLQKKVDKAAMVLENNERQHATEMKLAHVQGLLQGKDSTGNLPTLGDILATPSTCNSSLNSSFGSLGGSLNSSF